MKMTYNEVIHEIQKELIRYMEAEGIEVTSNGVYSCPNKLNHANGDTSASGSLKDIDGIPKWKCFKCDIQGNTINMASFIHSDLPIKGAGFKYETMPYIAEKIGLEYELEEEKMEDHINLALDANKTIKRRYASVDDLTSDVYGRRYSPELAQNIIDLNFLCKAQAGGNRPSDNPILHPAYEEALIVPLFHDGLLKGTVGRHKEALLDRLPKYENSIKLPEDGIDYPSVLNLEKGIESAKRLNRLYIFEGIFNTLAAMSYELTNSVGILGVGATKTELETMLIGSGVTEIVMCLDKDQAGIDAAYDYAKSLHSFGFSVVFYAFQNEGLTLEGKYNGTDYDEDISKEGINFINKLKDPTKLITMLEFLVIYKAKFMAQDDITRISKYELVINDISKYGNPMYVKAYSEILASLGGEEMSPEDYVPKVKQVLRDSKSPLMNKIDDLARTGLQQILDATTLEEKQLNVAKLNAGVNDAKNQGTVGIKVSAKRKIETLLSEDNNEFSNFYRTGYENMDEEVNGISKITFADSMMIGIGGKPSHGKSILARGLMTNWMQDYKDDVMCIYFSEDDPQKRTLNWMLAGLSGVPFMKLFKPDPQEKERIDQARTTIKELFGESFLIYDKSEASYASDIVRIVNDVAAEYPGKKVITVVDNMFNVNDISRASAANVRKATESYADQIKELTVSGHTIINTLEVNKNVEGRLNEKDIKETGAIDFRNDITILMYNSFKEKGPDSQMVRMDGHIPIPIIEVTVRKDKLNQAGTTFFFELDGPTGILRPVTDLNEIDTYTASKRTDKPSSKYSAGGSSNTQGQGTSDYYAKSHTLDLGKI